MATHPGMLLAYDDDGNVIGTLSYKVVYADDPDRTPLGLVDFAAHEEAGGELTDVWTVSEAKGSKVWPEWIGGRAQDFRVELEGEPGAKRIAALVHRTSHRRRNRKVLETRIAKRIREAKGKPADIRDLVGGPDRPIRLDERGAPIAVLTDEQLTVLPLASAGQQQMSATEGDTILPDADDTDREVLEQG